MSDANNNNDRRNNRTRRALTLELPNFTSRNTDAMADRLVRVLEFLMYTEGRRAWAIDRINRANRRLDEYEDEIDYLNRRIRTLETGQNRNPVQDRNPGPGPNDDVLTISSSSSDSSDEDPTYTPPGN